jgi:hypothetical protein
MKIVPWYTFRHDMHEKAQGQRSQDSGQKGQVRLKCVRKTWSKGGAP